jgi:hypothetical protein
VVAGINAKEAIATDISVALRAYRTVCVLNQEKKPHKLNKNFLAFVFGLGVCKVLNVLLLFGLKESTKGLLAVVFGVWTCCLE